MDRFHTLTSFATFVTVIENNRVKRQQQLLCLPSRDLQLQIGAAFASDACLSSRAREGVNISPKGSNHYRNYGQEEQRSAS